MERLSEKKKKKKKKKYKLRRFIDVFISISPTLFMVFCVLCLSLIVTVRNVKAERMKERYAKQELELTKELKKEEDKHKYLLDYKIYVKTDEYIIDTATSKLGLVYKDTIVIRSDERFK